MIDWHASFSWKTPALVVMVMTLGEIGPADLNFLDKFKFK